jgi:hypothetical protein
LEEVEQITLLFKELKVIVNVCQLFVKLGAEEIFNRVVHKWLGMFYHLLIYFMYKLKNRFILKN